MFLLSGTLSGSAEGVFAGAIARGEDVILQGQRQQRTHAGDERIGGQGQAAAGGNGMHAALQAVAQPVECLAALLGNALGQGIGRCGAAEVAEAGQIGGGGQGHGGHSGQLRLREAQVGGGGDGGRVDDGLAQQRGLRALHGDHPPQQRLLQAAFARGVISYDPNYRAPLWDNVDAAVAGMRSVLSYVDVMKLSDEETELLTGKYEPEDAAKELLEKGVKIVAVTLGAEGALVCTKEGSVVVPGYKANLVDTTGAGDSFWGGFLHKLLESGKRPENVTLEEAASFAKYGNAVASLCVEKRGAIPAMPTIEDVAGRL